MNALVANLTKKLPVVRSLVEERDAAFIERDIALAERAAAFIERDEAQAARDAAVIERNAAFTAGGTGRQEQIWDERALTESREPIGSLGSEAEEVFKLFTRYKGVGRSGYVTNFLGCVNDVRVSSGLKIWDGTVEDYPVLGNFHGSTMEWVGTLKAVLGARDVFRMLELGAGWGPWCVIGYTAAVQRGISDIQVVGVEGDSGHIKYMEENFAANDLKPGTYSIITGVVGLADGEATFPKAKDPSEVYGGAPAFSTCADDQRPFNYFMKYCSEFVDQCERVPAFSLETLTAGFPIVDLVHCDIQGGELDLFANAIQLISRKVKRVVIGTHSWQIDHGLIGLFATHGWVLDGAEDCIYRGGAFHDGTQVWRNPLLTN
jgi:FkbM family methyltransferase